MAHITDHRARTLDLIANHESNAAIAAALAVARTTANHEIEHLRDLTGCTSKAELARWWLAHREIWREAVGR